MTSSVSGMTQLRLKGTSVRVRKKTVPAATPM